MSLPPTYSEATGQHASEGLGLSHIDFLPKCTDPAGFFSSGKYEPFGELIKQANEWLERNHHTWEAKTCESIEFKSRNGGDVIETEKMTFTEYGEMRTHYVRALRLWIIPRPDNNRPPQRLNYINVIPNENGGGQYRFEKLEDMVKRINSHLVYHPIQGRVLTIETQEMKYKSSIGNVDPDRTGWSEDGESERQFLMVIRIFFVEGEPMAESIGFADFTPKDVTNGRVTECMADANRWCQQQRGVRYTNVQCLEVKLKNYIIDPQRTYHVEHGERRTHYSRIIRVCYVSSEMSPDHPALDLHYKLFEPVCLQEGGMFKTAVYETMSETLKRVSAWMRASEARLLSAETSAFKQFAGYKMLGDPNDCYSVNKGDTNDIYKFVIRLYFDGPFREVHAEELPPVPQPQPSDECCRIL